MPDPESFLCSLYQGGIHAGPSRPFDIDNWSTAAVNLGRGIL